MKMYELTNAELKTMEIIWEKGCIPSGELVKECASRFAWKKSTTYTILKKICEKEAAVNEGTVVKPLVTEKEYYDSQKTSAIERYFSGSLPQFLAAFIRKENLSRQEITELEKIIDEYKEELHE